jgi:outer membrane protein TolC
MTLSTHLKPFGTAVLRFGSVAAFALTAAAQQPLPAAPSAVLAAQYESQARPAGSGFTFTAATTQPGPGGVRIEQANDAPLALSLDDAIALALARNVRLKYDLGNEKAVKGDTLGVFDALLPNLTFSAKSNAQELNLAAMGFSPVLLGKFSSTGLLPAGFKIATIVKVNTTQASLNASQQLFNLTDYELYRGTKNETAVVNLATLNDRGDVVLNVGTLYLQILADQANLANAKAQVVSAKTVFDQATSRHNAGVGIQLDVLRGQVEYQQRQQDAVSAENQLAKDMIQLTRVMGIPVGQAIELTDTAPYSEFESMDLETAKATAELHRKDLLSVQQQILLTQRELKAVKFQRLPSLAFNGYYGIIGVTTGSYHGDFNAEASLSVPIFREAAQRGQQQIVDSQLTALHQREADLHVAIDSQIRSSMLDVNSAAEMVKVAQSNVLLAQQELSDADDRFKAGVDDNLPLVDAEATVASAQSQLVQSLYQLNVAKLQLARNTGVVETRYRTYLGK